MTEETTKEQTTERESEHRRGHCGPWGSTPHKMWMFGPMMAAKMAGRSFRSPYGRGSRAQKWMYENPSDEQIILFLEEFQRDLEEQIEDVRTRIDEIRSRGDS